jgi:hypothetical protein
MGTRPSFHRDLVSLLQCFTLAISDESISANKKRAIVQPIFLID